MISNLYEKVNYISGLKFLFSTYIREYDISKANINILYSKGVLSKDMYDKLKVATREERQITIGIMQLENNKVQNILSSGIIEAKKQLFEANNIQDADILSIKNDAVFIINKALSNTRFGENIEFKLKNTFTDFIHLQGIEIYYGIDRVFKTETIEIKGLGKNRYLHDNFMTDFIIYMITELESGNVESAISSFTDFYNDYINGDLNIGYYREYNSTSMYSIINQPYKMSNPNNDKYTKTKVININYNLNILRQLFGYISEKYFIDKRF